MHLANVPLLGVSVILAVTFLLFFDFPDELKPPTSWFRVLWGYPTFINYVYDDIYTHPVLNYEHIAHLLPKEEPSRELILSNERPQRCDFALSSPGRCYYQVTEDKCSPNGRLPLLWEDTVVECFDVKEAEVDCLLSEKRIENSTCWNVPDRIVYESEKTLIYFTNVELNSWHVEKSEILLEHLNDTFAHKETVVGNAFFGLWRPDNGRHCSGSGFETVKYGIDMFSTCYKDVKNPTIEEECNELAETSVDFLLSQVNVSNLCKGNLCDIPVVLERPRNKTYWLAENETATCSVPSRMVLTIFTNDSRIQEVQAGFTQKNLSCSETSSCLVPLETHVEFKEAEEKVDIARFWLKRGRFHCPSEVTCWREMFYFFTLIDFHGPFAQYLTLIPIILLSALYLFKKHYTQSFCNLIGLK